jgi:hypothetical protein
VLEVSAVGNGAVVVVEEEEEEVLPGRSCFLVWLSQCWAQPKDEAIVNWKKPT